MKARAEILELLQDHIHQKKNKILRQLQYDTNCGEEETAADNVFDVIISQMFIESRK